MKRWCLTLLLSLPSLGLAQQTTLTIAHPLTGGASRAAFDEIVADFEAAHPDIKVEQISQDSSIYEDAGLITMLKSGDPPDIYFQWGGALVARDANEGFAADLTDALGQKGWADTFGEAAWSAPAGTVVGGRTYMIPVTLDLTTVLWYNTDMFEEYGIAEPATWADFVSAVETLADNGVTPIVVGNKELWPLGNWAAHLTARVVSPETFDAAFRLEEPFNQEAFVRAFGLLEELQQAGAFNVDLTSLDAASGMSTFFQSAAAMHPIGSWLVPAALETAPEDFRYDVFNTPAIEGGEGAPASIIGLATGYMVSAGSEHKDEALTFLEYFTSPEVQVAWAASGQFSPVKGAMEEAALDPHLDKLAAIYTAADAIVPPPDTGYPVEVADVFYQGAAYVAAGQKSPKEALAWVDKQLEPLKSN